MSWLDKEDEVLEKANTFHSDRPAKPRKAVSKREIPRSDVEVGFANPRPPFICCDSAGRWRNAHCFDERDLRGQHCCLWCGKPKRRCVKVDSAA